MKPLEKLFSLAGKIAVVTDCGGNSSREIVPLLAEAGATIVLADRDAAAAQALARISADQCLDVHVIPTDIQSEDEVKSLFEKVRQLHGRLDILVNCAGMTANLALTDISLAVWDQVQSLNLRATFLCMREGIKLMLAAGNGGRIVNVTTMGALHPVLNGNAAYGSARAGVTMLGRSAALDYLPQRILVNTVMPGAFADKVRFHPATAEALASGQLFTGPGMQPERRPMGMGQPADIAAAVLYLVGPSGAYITGQNLVLDGGFLVT